LSTEPRFVTGGDGLGWAPDSPDLFNLIRRPRIDRHLILAGESAIATMLRQKRFVFRVLTGGDFVRHAPVWRLERDIALDRDR
jgi:hypothetical protein